MKTYHVFDSDIFDYLLHHLTCTIRTVWLLRQMFVYQAVATVSNQLNMMLLVLVGLLVNGPYALITTAVSADLGTSLRGNAKALATVTAIIDGECRCCHQCGGEQTERQTDRQTG